MTLALSYSASPLIFYIALNWSLLQPIFILVGKLLGTSVEVVLVSFFHFPILVYRDSWSHLLLLFTILV